MSKILGYLKAVVAAVGSLISVVLVATADQAVTLDEARGVWLAVVSVATVAGVYAVKNRDGS